MTPKRPMTDDIRHRYPWLLPFQAEGVEHLARAGGCGVLADDAGLGKTLQALALMDLLGLRRVLVVAPNSVVHNWIEETQRWLGWTMTAYAEQPSRLTVIGWHDLYKHYVELDRQSWQMVVYDEAHRMKSLKSQWTKAARWIGRGIKRLLFLTGTLVINRPEEAWPIFNLLAPQRWPSFANFKLNYADYTHYLPRRMDPNPRRFNEQIAWAKQQMYAHLADAIAPYVLRRTKRDPKVAAQLPPTQLVQVSLTLPQAYRRPYAQARSDLLSYLRSNGLPTTGAERAEVLVKLGVLRKLAGLAKVPAVVERAQDLLSDEAAKVVVYTRHREVGDVIEQQLQAYGLLRIKGGTPTKRRHEYVTRFREGPERVMLISEAGEEGINLQRSSYVIFGELPWHPKGREQVWGRVDRLGQALPTTAYWMMMLGTVDEHINQLIAGKDQMVDGIIGQDERTVISLAEMEMQHG